MVYNLQNLCCNFFVQLRLDDVILYVILGLTLDRYDSRCHHIVSASKQLIALLRFLYLVYFYAAETPVQEREKCYFSVKYEIFIFNEFLQLVITLNFERRVYVNKRLGTLPQVIQVCSVCSYFVILSPVSEINIKCNYNTQCYVISNKILIEWLVWM